MVKLKNKFYNSRCNIVQAKSACLDDGVEGESSPLYKEYISPFLRGYESDFSRYRSYDFVHKLFVDTIDSLADAKKSGKAFEPDWDNLALNLYMFLASWGMLRNSFLLMNNYKRLIEICKLLCGVRYCIDGKQVSEDDFKDCTWLKDVNPISDEFNAIDNNGKKSKYDKYVADIMYLVEQIEAIFKANDTRRQLKKKKKKQGDEDEIPEFERFNQSKGEELEEVELKPSDTLVTKILLATLGCVPAYDKYVKASLRNLGCTYSNVTANCLSDLLILVNLHKDALNKAISEGEIDRKNCNGDKEVVTYSTMKYLDMILWVYGSKNNLV